MIGLLFEDKDDDDEYIQGHNAPEVYKDDQEPTQNYTDLGSENNDEQEEEEEEEGTSCHLTPRDSDDQAGFEGPGAHPHNVGPIQDVVQSHRSKNKGSHPLNADKLAHHRRLQQDAPTTLDNGRGEKDIQEAGSDDEEEEEEPTRKRKRRTKRGGSPTPTQQGFYAGEWSQVISLNSFKVQEHPLSSGFFSTKAQIEREAPEWAAQSILEIEDYVELELSPAFCKEYKDDINKMMWMEVSHYRGSAKNDCRAIINQYYDISSGPSGYKSPGEIASNVKALLENLDSSSGKVMTIERIDNMMAPALGKVMELMLWGGENKRGSHVGDAYAHQFEKYTTRHISAAAAVLRCCIEEKKTGYHQNVNLSADNFESFYNTVYDKLEKSRADNDEHWNKMNV
ncbi:hypothetical protein B0H16DRAFT_1687846 [Mycena metata]|uniref:DUF6532 domain-containing protein n=1 Tax=Mycena metata TaxID=1033252 RepID=A0AAD7JI69_9AGAR|nr:hypothetical protein B0H16DRAFT_1687846 [Mycena metata]